MVIAETGSRSVPGETKPPPHLVHRAVSAAPVVLPLLVAATGAVGTVLLLLGQFRPQLVIGLGLLVTVGAVRVLPRPSVATRGWERWCDALAVLVALAFAAVNARYTSQNIFVGRDPGVYTVAGQWLAHHHSVLVPSQIELFQPGPVTGGSAGIGGAGGGLLYTQGAHLLPQMLGLASSVLGESAMFRLNVALGGLGLLALYGFGRLVAGHGWALLAVVVLGGSLPQIAFSRDDYTEPLSQLLVFGGLSLLWAARRERPLDWAAAGLVLGASCMARIDAFLVLPPLVVFVAVMCVAAPRGRRRTTALAGTSLLAGAALPAVLGVLDLKRLSVGYFHDLHGQFHMIVLLLVASTVASGTVVVLGWSGPVGRRLTAAGPGWRRWSGPGAAAAVMVVGVGLAVRPLLGAAHGRWNLPTQQFIRTSQVADGSRVDAGRTYAEQSVTWLTWYLGPVVVVLALVGIAWLVLHLVRRGRLELLPFLLVFLSTAGLYLWNPSITPDQIWVMRRYVPIVMPGVVVGTAYACAMVQPRLSRRWAPMVGGALVVAMVVPVANVTWPLARAREGVPQLTEARRVCARLPRDAAVLVIGELALRYPQTVRSYCRVPTAALVPAASTRVLAGVASNVARSGRRLYLLSSGANEGAVPTSNPMARPVSEILVKTWMTSLVRPPHAVALAVRKMYVGKVGADGLVAWIDPASPVD